MQRKNEYRDGLIPLKLEGSRSSDSSICPDNTGLLLDPLLIEHNTLKRGVQGVICPFPRRFL